jgi:hypothetical protein
MVGFEGFEGGKGSPIAADYVLAQESLVNFIFSS